MLNTKINILSIQKQIEKKCFILKEKLIILKRKKVDKKKIDYSFILIE